MNDKSIFKKLVCPDCKKWVADETGKTGRKCSACGVQMVHSAKWHVRVTRQGRTSLKAISSRRQEAVDYLHAAKDAIRRGSLLPGEEKNIAWDDAVKAFKKWIDGGSLAPRTKEFYHNCVKHLDKHFDDDLQEITVQQVEEYRDDRAEVAAPKTVAEEIKALKRIYSLHTRWHSARIAPGLHAVAADLARVEMPKYNNKRVRFLAEHEVKYLLDKCDHPALKLAIKIALATGLRKSNIMGLEWRQIDFINRSITFDADDLKPGRQHISPIMGSLAVDLKEWRTSSKRITPFVFPAPFVKPGEKLKAVARMETSWRNLLEDCNQELKKQKKQDFSDVCFHTLRHTFASHFLMNGGDLATLSELLDHASIQITKDRYGHLSSEHKRKAIDAFEGVFFQSAADR
jgi:integrase